jgi:hypothetical protein
MKTSLVWLLLSCCLLLSCKKRKGGATGNCNNAVDSLTVFPLNYAHMDGLVPLGNLNPPGHTFPTDHVYLYLDNPAVKVPVYSPGNIKLIRINRSQRIMGGSIVGEDYSLEFCIGNNYVLRFSHVSELSPTLQGLVTADIENHCETYSTGGTTYKQCRLDAYFNVSAGEEIGKAGGQPGQYALDLGVYKNGMSSLQGATCPFNFYTAAQYAVIKTKFSNYNGTVLRTIDPVCGEVLQDVPNTVKGIWLKAGLPFYPEDPHIAFVQDNVNPLKPAFSVGTSQTGLSSGTYTYNVQNSGMIDRNFTNVVNDGNIYCFNIQNYGGGGTIGSMLLKLASNTTIDAEYRAGCNCACNTPYVLSSNKVSYTRPAP